MEWSPSPLHATKQAAALAPTVAAAKLCGEAPALPLLTVDQEVDSLGFGRFQVIALLVLGLANASDAVELLCLSFILPQLTLETGEALSSSAKAALSSAIFVGMLAGGLVFGLAADSLGRRTTLTFSLAVNGVFGLLAAASPQFGALLACRVLAGFGVGGSIPGVFTLAAELLPTPDRGFWLSTVAWWWMVGAVYTAGAAWVMLGVQRLSWQAFAAVCALPALAAAALVLLLLPESPRFLHTRGSAQGALDALLFMARANGRQSRLELGWRLVEPPAPSAGSSSSSSSGGSGSGSGSGSRGFLCLPQASIAPVRDFFSPGNRRVAALLCTVWFCLSLGWYGLIGWIPTLFKNVHLELDVYQDSFLVAAAYLPGNIVSALLMERIGRRGVLASSLLLACMSAIAFPFAKTEATVVLAACTLNAVSTCSCEWAGGPPAALPARAQQTHAPTLTPPPKGNALDCLSVESFPTSLRTTSLGILAATGRIGSIVGQWVFGSLIDKSIVALLSVAALFLGVGAIAAWLLPAEIKSKSLQETATS